MKLYIFHVTNMTDYNEILATYAMSRTEALLAFYNHEIDDLFEGLELENLEDPDIIEKKLNYHLDDDYFKFEC